MEGHHDTGAAEAVGVAALGGGVGVLGAWTAGIRNRKLGWRELFFGCGLPGLVIGGVSAELGWIRYPNDYGISILCGVFGGLLSALILETVMKMSGFGMATIVSRAKDKFEKEMDRYGFQKKSTEPGAKTDGRSDTAARSDGTAGGSLDGAGVG